LQVTDTTEKSIKETLDDAERVLVLRALDDHGGKKGLTADKLGISRHALKRRIKKLGIE
jgi:transcriptional regulator with PAS, ATPase and Fis domain